MPTKLPPKAPDTVKGDILIVDDMPENLRLLTNALANRGYEIRAVLNGAVALDAIQTDPPDLVLLDIRMPEMDGYEVCRRLKSNRQTRHIPIIFLSALNEPQNKVKAFQVGGVDYITKPFHTEEVLARVNNQLTISTLQKQLIAKNAELRQSNQELEQFSYVVSHDLKQPLQAIIGFAQLLNLKYQQLIDAEGSGFLIHIVEASTRMTKLIDQLLAYSRVGSQVKALEQTDCNVVVAQVLANIKEDIAERDAKITYQSLPVVMADSIQLQMLFQNLLSNAIKFHKKADGAPVVAIAAEQAAQVWHFTVRDQGIGIASAQFERIFQFFHRVHSQDEFPGTGIGLATCKKVVERHGGSIWVESELGSGTCFHFTLPVKAPISVLDNAGLKGAAHESNENRNNLYATRS